MKNPLRPTFSAILSCTVLLILLSACDGPTSGGLFTPTDEGSTAEDDSGSAADDAATSEEDDGSTSTSNSLNDLPGEARAFVTLVNEHRESIGLTALEWHPQLAGVALAHSQDMVDRDYFSHFNPEGDSPFDRMTAAGIGYTGAAENVAWGQATGEAVLAAWLNSAGSGKFE